MRTIIFIVSITLTGCIPSNKNLALDYLFCTHCSINEDKFKQLRNQQAIVEFQNNQLSEEEYDIIVDYAAYQYDHYFRPFIEKTNNEIFVKIKNTTKKQFIEEKLAVYKIYRKEKVDIWQLNINSKSNLSRDSLLQMHTPYYNYSNNNEVYFSQIEKNAESQPIDGYCPVKLKNRWGYVSDYLFYMNNEDCIYLSTNKSDKIYPLIFIERRMGDRTYKIINPLKR